MRRDAVAELLTSPAPPGRGAAPVVMVVAAHPDDEVIGLGARLPSLGPAAAIVHVTDGAPRRGRDAVAREAYARARRGELAAALSLAGVAPGQARELGCGDQEASFRLADLSLRVAGLLAGVRPGVVVTHPYEGGHPDHDAAAFAVHAACRLVRERGVAPPALVEMTSYHVAGGEIEPYTFLPADGYEVTAVALSDGQRDLKRRLLACFVSQRDTLRYFLPPPPVERFRPAPAYDFTRPPHPGKLFYEYFDWGMTGERFRTLAAEASNELGIGGAAWG